MSTKREVISGRRVAATVAALVVGLIAGRAQAADVTWNGTTDMTWSQPDTTSWSATYASGDNVTFTSTGAGTVTVSGTVNPGNFSIISGTTHAFTGAGSTLSASGASFQVGPAVNTDVTANMSGLSQVVYNNSGGTFRVGLSAGGGYSSINTLTLAGNNTITAANLYIADQMGATSLIGGAAHRGYLYLGAGNVINADNINCGYSGRSFSILAFAGGSSSATFRGTDGTSPVTLWRVGNVANNGNTTWTDTVNFSNGSIDAMVTELTIGCADIGSQLTREGTETATFTMGAGSVTVTNLNIGRISNIGGGTTDNPLTANGTFAMNNSASVLNAGAINLAINTITDVTAYTKTVNGTLTMTAGTLKATTIQKGEQTGTATATATFNWSSGTIQNLPGTDLTIQGLNTFALLTTGAHIFDIDSGRTGTVSQVISGSGTLTKAGAGTLALGTNNMLNTSINVSLSAGTLAMGAYTNTLGTLEVAGSATISLGSGSLAFAESKDVVWSGGQLTLTGTLGPTTLRFGTGPNALTKSQVESIRRNGLPVILDDNGYVLPVKGTVIFIR